MKKVSMNDKSTHDVACADCDFLKNRPINDLISDEESEEFINSLTNDAVRSIDNISDQVWMVLNRFLRSAEEGSRIHLWAQINAQRLSCALSVQADCFEELYEKNHFWLFKKTEGEESEKNEVEADSNDKETL